MAQNHNRWRIILKLAGIFQMILGLSAAVLLGIILCSLWMTGIGILFLILFIFSILYFLSGLYMFRQINYRFTLNMNGFVLMFVPVGTLIGGFMLWLLYRKSTETLYDSRTKNLGEIDLEGRMPGGVLQ